MIAKENRRKHRSQLRRRVLQGATVPLRHPNINIGVVCGKEAGAKMSTPFRSRSSAMGPALGNKEASGRKRCAKNPALGKGGPHTTATRETYPGLSAAPITRGNPSHQALRQVGGNSANEPFPPPRAPSESPLLSGKAHKSKTPKAVHPLKSQGRRDFLSQASGAPLAPITPRAVINHIHGGPLDEEYDSKRKRQRLLRAASVRERINSIRPGLTSGSAHPIDGTIIFPLVYPIRILQPHRDALIMFLGIGDFDVRRILVYPGSSADLLQVSAIKQMGLVPSSLENMRWILSGFNGATITSLGDVVLSVQAGPIILNVQFSVVEDLSPFNAILGRTWLHYMKAIPSTYHQMVSFLTEDGHIDLYGSQLAARQCYQIGTRSRVLQRSRAIP
ncbi:hypothetical protein CK203_113326 [Vitis vinifera]|uniref:Uncharacterized protein n=1 Tax=Vitis vinifera TaxID=29760 RepID=A0A438FDC5_VITVI|nr:hypothetical protein CK203_113326 [Vitis vinifera]